jgi:hypothetical protein
VTTPSHLSPTSFVSAATSYIGLGDECDVGAGRRSRLVEQCQRQVDCRSDEEWSAAFVHHVGYWSQYDHTAEQSRWPLPPAPNARLLAAYARERGALLEGLPQEGDVFVQRSPAKRWFVRAGIVVRVLDVVRHFAKDTPMYECTVIEGNSDAQGSLGAPDIVRITRRLSPLRGDRLIRWVLLQPRAIVAFDDARDFPMARAA